VLTVLSVHFIGVSGDSGLRVLPLSIGLNGMHFTATAKLEKSACGVIVYNRTDVNNVNQ